MEHKNTKKDKKPNKLTKPVLLLWIIPLLLLILVTIITVIGVHFLESREGGDVTSQLRDYIVLILIIVVILLIIASLRLYASVRYIQLPTWRWMAKGFKDKLNIPWLKKSKENEIKK